MRRLAPLTPTITLALALPAAALAQSAPAAPAPATLPPAVAALADPPSIHDPAAVNPATALPADAILPGAAGVRGIACALDPASDGTARSVAVIHPWSAAPMLIGPEGPRPARFFKRGRTLIFDAGRTVLYIDRDHHHATLSLSTPRAVQNLRGLCRVTP